MNFQVRPVVEERYTPQSVAPDVAIVITTYNHAHFLAEALESCVRQSVPPAEIVVVDDGSTDDPVSVVARFPGVRLIQQENRGLAAARNAAIPTLCAAYVVFLDADDRLLPDALEAGLAAAARHPEAAIVYGGFRLVDSQWRPIFRDEVRYIESDPYIALLRWNVIGCLSAALIRRDVLAAEGGFDRTLRCFEDQELYLRLVRRHPVVTHGHVVAEYRKHGSNMSDGASRMLAAALLILDREAAFAAAYPGGTAALMQGRRRWRAYFAFRAFGGAVVALTQPGRRASSTQLFRQAFSVGMIPIAEGAARWLLRQAGRIVPSRAPAQRVQCRAPVTAAGTGPRPPA